MTPAEQPSRNCCVCKKLFCCVQCRERHEKKKHSDQQLKCPLCTTQKFPLQLLEDKSLFCHITTDHLPLHCILCRDVFIQSNDLESFGICKWWKSHHRNSLIFEQNFLGTSPTEGKENVYSDNFISLTSPPEFQRNTSTPMLVSQKSNQDLKTLSAPNFSLKTPKTDSQSLTSEIHSDFRDSGSISNYVSFPSSASHKETPFRSACSSRGHADSILRSNSRQLGIMKEQEEEASNANDEMLNMELTCIEDEVLSDSKDIRVQKNFRRRSDSLKKVRFSDQYDPVVEPDAPDNCDVTENEEFFETCDTISDAKEPLENSRVQIYEENAENIQKDNSNPNKSSVDVTRSSSLARFVMMMVMESGSNLSTSELISSSLKKFDSITLGANNMSKSSRSCVSCRCLSKTVDSHCCISSHESYSSSTQMMNVRRDSSSLNSSGGSNSSGGLFSTVANAVKSVVKSISGMAISGSIEREVSEREDIVIKPSTSTTFIPLSQFTSSLMQRPGKRTRDNLDTSPSSNRQLSLEMPHLDVTSPLRKRHRGWSRIKCREPIARMRNNQLTSPRGISSETQVFHQGSLSVGDTILPLPNRAHQSTQTE